MANLTHSKSFSAVIQLETIDDVMAGPGGLANSQAQSLGNRDEFLLDLINRNGFANSSTNSATATLTSASAGIKIYHQTGSNYTITLPLLSASADGDTYRFLHIGRSNILTISTQGGNQIQGMYSNGGLVSSVVLAPGDTLELRVVAGGWSIITASSYKSVPAGAIITSASSVVPDGYLRCNSQSISKASYPQLYAAIGGTYGQTTLNFQVPDDSGGGANGVGNISVYYFIKY